MIVVDASVLAPALGDDGVDGDRARSRLRGETLAAPELIDLEVSSVLRKFVVDGRMADRRAEMALADLIALPIRRITHRVLLQRCWSLRENLTMYGATYVALAERLDALLVTADSRLSGAPGIRCEVEVMARPSSGGDAPP